MNDCADTPAVGSWAQAKERFLYGKDSLFTAIETIFRRGTRKKDRDEISALMDRFIADEYISRDPKKAAKSLNLTGQNFLHEDGGKNDRLDQTEAVTVSMLANFALSDHGQANNLGHGITTGSLDLHTLENEKRRSGANSTVLTSLDNVTSAPAVTNPSRSARTRGSQMKVTSNKGYIIASTKFGFHELV